MAAHRQHSTLEVMLVDEPQPACPGRVVPQRGAVAEHHQPAACTRQRNVEPARVCKEAEAALVIRAYA